MIAARCSQPALLLLLVRATQTIGTHVLKLPEFRHLPPGVTLEIVARVPETERERAARELLAAALLPSSLGTGLKRSSTLSALLSSTTTTTTSNASSQSHGMRMSAVSCAVGGGGGGGASKSRATSDTVWAAVDDRKLGGIVEDEREAAILLQRAYRRHLRGCLVRRVLRLHRAATALSRWYRSRVAHRVSGVSVSPLASVSLHLDHSARGRVIAVAIAVSFAFSLPPLP